MSVQTVIPSAVAAGLGASPAQSTSSTNQNAAGSLDTTFLSLLITELKSQDPTAPMDATQMVGQMVSLNQLDQLIGIHQILQTNGAATGSSIAPAAAQGGN